MIPSSECGRCKLGTEFRSPASHRRNRRQLVCRATTRTYQPNNKPLIKICGITNPSDAEIAAKAGADFVGMIMWPKARRAVSIETAAKISETVRRSGAQPVAVFVDEDFADIVKTCKAAGIGMAQLHGKGSRQALQDLPAWLKVVYVLHAGPDGQIQTSGVQDSSDPSVRLPDWYLVDGIKAGSGETYDWNKLKPPKISEGMQGWLLAGGLSPDNIGTAVQMLMPPAVDVSSGVTTPDGLTKDPDKIFRFVEAVRRAAMTGSKQDDIKLENSARS